MTWSPRTWVASEFLDETVMNAHVRDFLLQLEGAILTDAGDIPYATAANVLARLGMSGKAFLPLRANAGETAPEYAGVVPRQLPAFDNHVLATASPSSQAVASTTVTVGADAKVLLIAPVQFAYKVVGSSQHLMQFAIYRSKASDGSGQEVIDSKTWLQNMAWFGTVRDQTVNWMGLGLDEPAEAGEYLYQSVFQYFVAADIYMASGEPQVSGQIVTLEF